MHDENRELSSLIKEIEGATLFFVGIKGTGMSALAELFFKAGAEVSGSDIPEEFYTDKVLNELGIPFSTDFNPAQITANTQLVIHSSAYSPDDNPQLLRAIELGIPLLTYTQALGLYSSLYYSCGITGVHGKTTTSGIAGSLLQHSGLKGSVLVGSALPQFGNRATFSSGDNFFIAETCEYQRHFLDFNPSVILITNVEPDHLDYFKSREDIENAFVEYCRKLPADGTLIYCADDSGAISCAMRAYQEAQESGRSIKLIPYGFNAEGDFKISSISQESGRTLFTLGISDEEFEMRIPGRHLIQNSAGAAALITHLAQRESYSFDELVENFKEGFCAFRGSRRRSEIVAQEGGVLIIDDYAHHPTAIDVTLKGYRDFYPGRRLVVDFMSHTYSRTASLLDEFATCFSFADKLILNKIYASAREEKGEISGEVLFKEVQKHHKNVFYYKEYLDSLDMLIEDLKPGDIFITMGAGDNWQLGRALLEKLKQRD